MWRVIHGLVLIAALAAPLAVVHAQEPGTEDIRNLDEEVQDVKSEVLDISARLKLLEEQLLYPATTRLTVTMAIAGQLDARLGAAEIRLNGEQTARHVYGEGELVALQKGGIQNLYTGNVANGRHELSVQIVGTLADGSSFARTARHDFTKNARARTLEITVSPAGGDDNGIRIDDH